MCSLLPSCWALGGVSLTRTRVVEAMELRAGEDAVQAKEVQRLAGVVLVNVSQVVLRYHFSCLTCAS